MGGEASVDGREVLCARWGGGPAVWKGRKVGGMVGIWGARIAWGQSEEVHILRVDGYAEGPLNDLRIDKVIRVRIARSVRCNVLWLRLSRKGSRCRIVHAVSIIGFVLLMQSSGHRCSTDKADTRAKGAGIS